MPTASDGEFDLFISYAHADNGNGWLTALVEAIKAEHAKFTSTPLMVFFRQSHKAESEQLPRCVRTNGLKPPKVGSSNTTRNSSDNSK